MNPIPRQKLKEILIRFGTSVIDEPSRLRGILKDLVPPEHKREINALMLAVDHRIPAELQKGNQNSVVVIIIRLARKLYDEVGLAEDVARWAVETWALALQLTTENELASGQSTSASVPVATQSTSVQSVPRVTKQAPQATPIANGGGAATSGSIKIVTLSYQVATVNDKGAIIKTETKSNKCFVEDLGNGITIEMMQIPAGVFMMGSPPTETERLDREGPQHQVNVPKFWMGMTVVTQAQYEAIMGSNPSEFKGANFPVESVNWNDAKAFCQKLSQKTRHTYRLPSEAEWEYACRAGTSTPFHFGPTITPELVNYDGNYPYGDAPKGTYRKKTTPVGNLGYANNFGLYDMHGNVWEWCEDPWHDKYNVAPTDGSVWNFGGDTTVRLLRGGSWYGIANYCRAAYRFRYGAGNRSLNIGIRVVCALQ